MATLTIGFTCRNEECETDLELEVSDCSRGYAAQTYGDPDSCSPGEGPGWSWPDEVVCDECGTVHDEAWMQEHLTNKVSERLAEPDEGPEYDETDDRYFRSGE
jgi:hypothetical protein